MNSRVSVIYVGGVSRSGSTILHRLIALLDGMLPLGELVHIWDRGIGENQLCGCGERFHSCGFWQDVLEASFGSISAAPARDVLAYQHQFVRTKCLAKYWRHSAALRGDKNFQALTAAYGDLLRGLVEVSGKWHLIDASKQPMMGVFLCSLPEVDLKLVHLVRDPRGVVYSMKRRRRRVEVVDGEAFMDRKTSVAAAVEWDKINLVTEVLGRISTNAVRIHYEDLCMDWHRQLQRIVENLAIDARLGALTAKPDVMMPVHHTVSGNPNRLGSGRTSITADTEWRTRMRLSDRLLVNFITAPLMGYYGYFRIR